MQITLIISLILSATTLQSPPVPPFTHNDLFKTSDSISFSKSKRTLKSIYLRSNKNLTLYCGCSFDTNKKINHESCNYSPRIKSNQRSHRLEFEHVVPAHALGKNLQCWKEPICTKKNGKQYRGRKCCAKVSGEFRQMQSDMHNLFPSVGEVNGDRSNFVFGEIDGEERKYGGCDFEVREKVAEPKESIRGDIARSYFYMSHQYKIAIPDDYEEMLREWHLSDPPDEWERERNVLIEDVQGNRNPFIDFPEMVEKVWDFN
jgi:deoxyribonuclease I